MEIYLLELCYILFRDFFQAMLPMWAVSRMLQPRFSRAVSVLSSALFSLTLEMVISTAFPLLRMTGSFLAVLVPTLVLYKDGVIYRVFATVLTVLAALPMDIIASYAVMAIFGEFPMFAAHTWNTVIFIFASDFLFAGGYLLVTIVWNKFIKKSHSGSLALFALFPLSQFVFFCAGSYQTWTVSKLDLMRNPFMLPSIIFSLVADIAMYIALLQNTKTRELAAKLTKMQREMDMQLQYYDGLARQIKQVCEYRHDINNLIEVTEALLHSESCSEDGRLLLEEIKERASSSKIPVYSANPTVNAVLYHKTDMARRKEIDISVSIDASESFPFERSDICSVFANLLDNAIREAADTERGFVSVTAARKKGLLFIEVTNSTKKSFDMEGAKLPTDKEDKGNHGLGLAIVDNIAKKYDGSFMLTAENGTARAVLTLPLENACVV